MTEHRSPLRHRSPQVQMPALPRRQLRHGFPSSRSFLTTSGNANTVEILRLSARPSNLEVDAELLRLSESSHQALKFCFSREPALIRPSTRGPLSASTSIQRRATRAHCESSQG